MLVVDASVAVKWFIQEPETAEARRLIADPHPLIAPDLVVPEVLNVVWRRLIRGDVDPDQVADVPGALPQVFAELWPVTWLASRAFEIATALRASPAEIVFTSGGTEADNLGVKGLAWAAAERGRRGMLQRLLRQEIR
jgi:predicted nucleic acid-binding protein